MLRFLRERAYSYYKRHHRAFLALLVVSVVQSSLFLFAVDKWVATTAVGVCLLVISALLLFLNVVGWDMFDAVTADEAFEEAKRMPGIEAEIADLEHEYLDFFSTAVAGEACEPDTPIARTLRSRITNLLDDYREVSRSAFVLRVLRYFVVFFCIFAVFTCATRVLVLSGVSHYKDSSLDASSCFTDHLYFAVMTMVTIGYGDIVPVTWEARLLCLVEGFTVLFALSFLLNDIFARESKREDRFLEALHRRFQWP